MKFRVNKSESHRIEVDMIHSKSTYGVYIESEGPELELSGESILSAALLPSMKSKEDIRCDIPICPKFLFSIRNSIQEVFNFWDKAHFHKSQVIAPINKHESVSTPRGKSACFFTGGVDSFYTLLKNKSDISDIIYVHGFDIKLEHENLRNEISDSLKSIASSLSLNLVEVETNLRDYLDAFVHWELSHGAALSFVGHCLSYKYDRIFISSTHTYAEEETFAWGSHPFIDHFWGGGKLEFTLDGCDKTRPEKVKFISSNGVALKYLRVCWMNLINKDNSLYEYNCGKCEKCVRTMLSLYIEDKLNECGAFKNQLTSRLIRSLRIRDKNTKSFLLGNIKAFPLSANNIVIYLNLIFVLIRAEIVIPLCKFKRILWKIFSVKSKK
jgi:hypothetical protein